MTIAVEIFIFPIPPRSSPATNRQKGLVHCENTIDFVLLVTLTHRGTHQYSTVALGSISLPPVTMPDEQAVCRRLIRFSNFQNFEVFKNS